MRLTNKLNKNIWDILCFILIIDIIIDSRWAMWVFSSISLWAQTLFHKDTPIIYQCNGGGSPWKLGTTQTHKVKTVIQPSRLMLELIHLIVNSRPPTLYPTLFPIFLTLKLRTTPATSVTISLNNQSEMLRCKFVSIRTTNSLKLSNN
jgi:hypothetical protein